MTVAIYEKLTDPTHGVWRRVCTWRVRNHYSVRAVSEAFMQMHPHADPSALYVSPRSLSFGRWVDSPERIPFDTGTQA